MRLGSPVGIAHVEGETMREVSALSSIRGGYAGIKTTNPRLGCHFPETPPPPKKGHMNFPLLLEAVWGRKRGKRVKEYLPERDWDSIHCFTQ